LASSPFSHVVSEFFTFSHILFTLILPTKSLWERQSPAHEESFPWKRGPPARNRTACNWNPLAGTSSHKRGWHPPLSTRRWVWLAPQRWRTSSRDRMLRSSARTILLWSNVAKVTPHSMTNIWPSALVIRFLPFYTGGRN